MCSCASGCILSRFEEWYAPSIFDELGILARAVCGITKDRCDIVSNAADQFRKEWRITFLG
jgi:hypothetical protein